MKVMLRFVLFSGWLMFRAAAHSRDTNFFLFLCFGQSNMEGFPGIDHLHFAPAGYRDLGTRYGLKMLSLLGYKSEASK